MGVTAQLPCLCCNVLLAALVQWRLDDEYLILVYVGAALMHEFRASKPLVTQCMTSNYQAPARSTTPNACLLPESQLLKCATRHAQSSSRRLLSLLVSLRPLAIAIFRAARDCCSSRLAARIIA